MKKIILLLAVILFSLSVSLNAQKIIAAGPAIFTPAQLGSYSTGTAYISKPPTLNAFRVMITASVYLLGTDGNLYEKIVTGEMIHIPGDWKGTFDVESGAVYPMPIPVTIQVKALTNSAGQILKNADGTIAVEQKVTFF
jgi:hypothetical protein